MKPPTRTWKRTLLTLSLFILAGAVINVAVAWGFAARSQFYFADGRSFRTTANEGTTAALILSHFGAYRIMCNYWARSREPSSTMSLAEGKLPIWINNATAKSSWALIDGYGAPCVSLRCEWSNERTDGIVLERGIRIEDSIKVAQPPNGSYFDWKAARSLPLQPTWPGFAINTIFYAAMLWLLFTAPGFVRRRIRTKRGLCPACAYPVGSSEVCTECGAPVRIQNS